MLFQNSIWIGFLKLRSACLIVIICHNFHNTLSLSLLPIRAEGFPLHPPTTPALDSSWQLCRNSKCCAGVCRAADLITFTHIRQLLVWQRQLFFAQVRGEIFLSTLWWQEKFGASRESESEYGYIALCRVSGQQWRAACNLALSVLACEHGPVLATLRGWPDARVCQVFVCCQLNWNFIFSLRLSTTGVSSAAPG